ncbi:MAG: hypothetical protein RBU27_14045 [Bacteroidota bacterium]|jgi:hypothetical protein|nr:hypothetical protein [Bacteroidota bacterium]
MEQDASRRGHVPANIVSAHRIIATQFDLEVDTGDETALLRADDIRAALIARIAALLSRDPERLMRILYRVDVEERKVQQIFHDLPPADMAAALADLIIDRQLAKAETRARYGNPAVDQSDMPPSSL